MSLPVAVATAALTASRPAGVRVVVVGREGGVRGRRSSSSPANQPTPWASSVGAFLIYFNIFYFFAWWGFHKNSAAASCWNVIPDSKKTKEKKKKSEMEPSRPVSVVSFCVPPSARRVFCTYYCRERVV